MKNIKSTITALFISFSFILGCESILEPEPKGQVALNDLMTTEEGMNTVVNGMFTPLQNQYQNPLLRLTDFASDDGWTWRNELETDLFIVEPTFSWVQNVWSNHYTGVSRTNIVLSNLSFIDDFTTKESSDVIEGQAKFMRAFYYFNLVRLFGDVPLIIKEIISREDAEQPRAPIQEVYMQIKSDLDDAIELLPTLYSGNTGSELGRPTSLAAKGLKALVHLELEEWDGAVFSTSEIIEKGSLVSNYVDNFNGANENGEGSLFEVQYGGVAGGTTTNISNFYAPTDFRGGAIILPTDDNLEGRGGGPSSGNGFVQAFEDGDLRKDVIIKHYGLANFIDGSKPDGSLFFINKYYNTIDPIGLSTWNFPLIRYAEMLLVRSEAMNEQEYVPNGEAFDLLNQVRINAGLPVYTPSEIPDQDSFREAIRKERRIELAFEAKRYFDLNRWGIMEETIQLQLDFLGLIFPSNKLIAHPVTGKKYYLYPIPNVEFKNNAQLGEQNPGYN